MNQTYTYKGLDITIEKDQYSECPLEWGDDAVQFVTFEDRSTLSDYHGFNSPEDCLKYANENGFEVFPLYKYEHGACSYQVTPFSCPWDSGQCGYVLVQSTCYAGPWINIAKSICEEVTNWCNGEVYGYTIKDKDGEHLDSCWGFIGFEYCETEAKEQADWHAKNIKKQRQNRVKDLIKNHVPLNIRAQSLNRLV